jgi:hypothetical protein
MSKKVLPTETVVDDLAGSPFFKRRPVNDNGVKRPVFTGEPSQAVPSPYQSAPISGQVPETAPVRPNDRTTERPIGRRIITRNSFEIYEDQMQSLRKLAYREKMDGKLGSMSQMVRDAIDHYLTNNKPAED